MLDRLFPNPGIRQRLLDGPMGPYLELLTGRLADLGYADGYMCNLVRLANSLGEWLQDHGLSPTNVGKTEIDAYIAAQARSAQGHLPVWMRGIRRLPALAAPFGILCRPGPVSLADPILDRFATYLKDVVGITPGTIRTYCGHVRPLVLEACDEAPPNWTRMDSAYLVGFILKHAVRPNATRYRVVSAVRTFLRFAVAERLVPASLLHAIPRIRRPRLAAVPRHLTSEELVRVLNACQIEENGSTRDRAYIALLARLGVRSGELRHLYLEDIDWAAGAMYIRKSKSGTGRTLPLPADAGALLADYLQSARPPSTCREVFLSAYTPHTPLGPAAVTTLVHAFLKRIGLDGPGRGSHCFRHTAATHMVRNGARLKDVADVLGHRSLTTTKIYIKVDEPSLTEVALPWPGGDV